jgi:colanic acid/amylovoran biosynthesis glycosyltransferase
MLGSPAVSEPRPRPLQSDGLRIAYVIPAYPPAPSQPFVVNEMVQVQDAGNAVYVVPLYAGQDGSVRHGTFERLRPAAVLAPALLSLHVVALALRTIVAHPLRVLRALGSAFRAAGWNPFAHGRLLLLTPKALAAATWLREQGVDRIHAHFASQTADVAAIAAAVSRIPFSFTAHAYDIYSTALRVRNDTLDWKLRTARQVFTVNDYAGALLRARLPAAHGGRVQTVYVGIPMQLFQSEPPAPHDGAFRMLCVARLCEKKGLDTLIDACAALRERGVAFSLRLFGDGPLRQALAGQIARHDLGAHVLLGGGISQEEVAREMRACHAFVMPCRRDRSGDMDGIPTVFMEAMATGRPVISCPVSGIPELVRDGETGLLVPTDDPRALADAIVHLAGNEALCVTLGRRGRALVERQHDERLTAASLLAKMRAADAANGRGNAAVAPRPSLAITD